MLYSRKRKKYETYIHENDRSKSLKDVAIYHNTWLNEEYIVYRVSGCPKKMTQFQITLEMFGLANQFSYF